MAVAEEREGGPVTLDLTEWDFNKADRRTRCRKWIENSKSLLLMGSPIDSDGEDEEQTRAVLHLAFICELCEIQVREGRYVLHTQSHSAKSGDQPTAVDFMNRFPDMFQTVTDRSLFDPNVPNGMNTLTRWLKKFRMRCTGTQLIDSLVHCAPNDHECNVPPITVGSMCCRGEGPAATSPTSAEAGCSCGGFGRRTSGGVGSGGRCQGRAIGVT